MPHLWASPERCGARYARLSMSAASAAALTATTLDDDAWDDLLSFIEERRVIPIVGPELLMVATERGPRLLFEWAAERLAARLNVNATQLPQPYTLNDVVCEFLAARGQAATCPHWIADPRPWLCKASPDSASMTIDAGAGEPSPCRV